MINDQSGTGNDNDDDNIKFIDLPPAVNITPRNIIGSSISLKPRSVADSSSEEGGNNEGGISEDSSNDGEDSNNSENALPSDSSSDDVNANIAKT